MCTAASRGSNTFAGSTSWHRSAALANRLTFSYAAVRLCIWFSVKSQLQRPTPRKVQQLGDLAASMHCRSIVGPTLLPVSSSQRLLKAATPWLHTHAHHYYTSADIHRHADMPRNQNRRHTKHEPNQAKQLTSRDLLRINCAQRPSLRAQAPCRP